MIFRFGNVKVKIDAIHPSGKMLQEEFLLIGDRETSDMDFVFNIMTYHDLSIPTDSIYCDGFYIKGDTYIIDARRKGRFGDLEFVYKWKGHPYIDEKFSITAYCDPRYADGRGLGLYSELKRFLDWNYLYPVERISKNLIYNLLEPFLNMYMLKLGQSFIHASAVSENKNAILFTGLGGVGKTSLTLKLVFNYGFKFMGDDLLIIDRDGRAYLYPKKIQIYAYNTENFQALQKGLMKGRNLFDRAHWHIFKTIQGPKCVRRRVSPEKILGIDHIGPPIADINRVYYIVPYTKNEVTVEIIDAGSLAHHSSAVIMKELWSVYRYFNVMEALTDLPVSLNDMMNKNQQLYKDIFLGKKCKIIYVPRNISPDKLVTAFLDDL